MFFLTSNSIFFGRFCITRYWLWVNSAYCMLTSRWIALFNVWSMCVFTLWLKLSFLFRFVTPVVRTIQYHMSNVYIFKIGLPIAELNQEIIINQSKILFAYSSHCYVILCCRISHIRLEFFVDFFAEINVKMSMLSEVWMWRLHVND